VIVVRGQRHFAGPIVGSRAVAEQNAWRVYIDTRREGSARTRSDIAIQVVRVRRADPDWCFPPRRAIEAAGLPASFLRSHPGGEALPPGRPQGRGQPA
jgi:hypothetical protein